MTLVRMAISLYGIGKHIPGSLKQQAPEWIGENEADQVDGYFSSEGKIILEIHRDKINVENARKGRKKLEESIHYNENQIGKIQKEISEGHMGRKGDLSKFEGIVSGLREELRIANDTVDSAVVDRLEFLIEDCN